MNIIKYEIIIPLLAFFSVIAVGASILLSRQQKRKMLEERLKDKVWAEANKPAPREKLNFLNFLGKVGNFISHGKASVSLWEQLVQAGYLSTSAPSIYIGAKMLLFIFGLIATAVLVLPTRFFFATKITLICFGGAIPFFFPNIVIWMRRKKRHDEICQHLPEAVDLLEICVSSGIGLDMAWNIVADQIQHVSPALAREMSLTNFEIHLGASRVEAMRHTAARTGADELSSLAAILIQTDRFGTSVATALREFAASMRETRSFTVEEKAEQMAVKLIIPMVLFIFPAVIIIIAGPAAITIAKTIIFAE